MTTVVGRVLRHPRLPAMDVAVAASHGRLFLLFKAPCGDDNADMRYLRFDPVGGASGDMILAALVALGADLAGIARRVRRILPEKVRLSQENTIDSGISGCRVTVHGTGEKPGVWPDADSLPKQRQGQHHHANAHGGRTLPEILTLLACPVLDPQTRRLAKRVFERLAEVEGRVHGRPPNAVHFHEIGAADSIADIVATCLALHELDIAGVSFGPLPCGVGTISCAHGAMPNPAPATMQLITGVDVVLTDEPFELVTPTAAALLTTWRALLATPPVGMTVLKSGIGIGHQRLNTRPNILRAVLLEAHDEPAKEGALLVLETNLDDCNPQWIADLIPRLLAAGALDAWSTPATMKKGRPGSVLSVLAPEACAEALCDLIFAGTTTFGIRMHSVQRIVLDRRFETASTPFGAVRVKVGLRHGRVLVRTPEYEECARCARAAKTTPRAVFEAAQMAFRGRAKTTNLTTADKRKRSPKKGTRHDARS